VAALPKAAAGWPRRGRGRRLLVRAAVRRHRRAAGRARPRAGAEGRGLPQQARPGREPGELRKQKLQVQEYVTQLEKQLPGKAEMDALLSDINQAGLGRGLQFELFRPGQVESRTTTPSCRSPSRSAASTTTWAPSPPTWPTCRASSRCTTCRSRRRRRATPAATCRWKPRCAHLPLPGRRRGRGAAKAAAEKAAKAAGAKK
jgi:hypothetical protein